MPTYVYKCSNEECNNNSSFEVRQSIKDSPLKDCPLCSKEVQKQVSAPMVVFKGRNWTTNGGSY